MSTRFNYKKFITKISACYYILTGRYEHWAIINVNRGNLIKMLCDKPFDVEGVICGLHPYNAKVMIKNLAKGYNDDCMILEKAAFEAEAELATSNPNHTHI